MAGFEEIVSRWWEFIRRTPTRMAAIVTLSLVGIVSICALTVSRGHDQREYLFNSHEFNPSELAAAEVAFAKAKLWDYEIVSRKIAVPRTRRGEYIKALSESDSLPIDFDEPKNENEFGRLIETRGQRQVRLQSLQEKRLAQAISHLTGIDKATVRFDERSTGGLKSETKISASVLVDCSAGVRLDDRTVDTIRRMVAGEKIGLRATDVTVTDLQSCAVFGNKEEPLNEASHQLAEQRRRVEQDWQRKITEGLSYLPSTRVVVTAEFDSKSNALANSVPPSIEKLAVLISVPACHYDNLWKTKRRNASGSSSQVDELRALRARTDEKIESIVKALTSVSVPETFVKVTSFHDQTIITEAGPWERMLDRLREHRVPFVILVGMVAMAVFRAITSVKTKRSQRPEHAVTVTTHFQDDRSTSKADPEPGLRDQLAEAVRRDPESAAKVLEGWMRKAG